MIHILDFDNGDIHSFENFRELAVYIKQYMERKKLFDDRPGYGQSMWSFIYHSPERVARLYYNLQKQQNPDKIKEAFSKRQSLVEICRGDYQNIIQIPGESWELVEEMEAAWCKEYCDAHNLRLMETED